MKQFELLQLVQQMEPGQCVDIGREDFFEAVKGELEGIDRLSAPRATDVEMFVAKIERNWRVEITANHEKGNYRLHKY